MCDFFGSGVQVVKALESWLCHSPSPGELEVSFPKGWVRSERGKGWNFLGMVGPRLGSSPVAVAAVGSARHGLGVYSSSRILRMFSC